MHLRHSVSVWQLAVSAALPPIPSTFHHSPLLCFLRCVPEHSALNLGVFIQKGSCVKLPNFETRRMHLNDAVRRNRKQAASFLKFLLSVQGLCSSSCALPQSMYLYRWYRTGTPGKYPNHSATTLILKIFYWNSSTVLRCDRCPARCASSSTGSTGS